MKKFFFFKSSSSNEADKKVHFEKTVDSRMKRLASEQDFNSQNDHQVEVSSAPALRRSRSLSSAAFLVDGFRGTSTNDQQHNHSSRCFTPERQVRERKLRAKTFQNDVSGSSSSGSSNVSSKVLDLYIDGEEHFERCKKPSTSSNSNVSVSIKQRKPPRAQWAVPTSPSDTKSQSFREAKGSRLPLSSTDWMENGSRHGSPRLPARSVFERLSQTHGNSKASNHKPITTQDVYGGSIDRTFESNSNVVPLAEHYEPVNGYYAHDFAEHRESCIHGKNTYRDPNYVSVEDDIDSELETKIQEAEKRVNLLSEELEQQRCISDCDFDVSSLVEAIRRLEDERVKLAFENASLLRSQMIQRKSAREESRRLKSDWNMHIQRLEKEKSELQAGLEKEFDRRSGEWTSKLENFHLEEKRLRERVRELAEQNVSLQRELSTFHENQTASKDMITDLERRVAELTTTAEELHEDKSYLKQTLSQLQESYVGTREDLDCLQTNFEEKDQECKDLHKSVTKFLRACKEQGKTIEALRDGVSKESNKQPLEKSDQLFKKLQMEQIRLTGVELSLRREMESMKLETDSLRNENMCLLNRLKGNGEEIDIINFKLENEIKMCLSYLQDQGISMLNESNQLCYKLLKFIKGKLTQFPEANQDTQSRKDGLSEQFMIESEVKVHGIRRGTENLKKSLQTVTNVVASNSESSCSRAKNLSVEETLQAELRTETLITSLLREKLYFKEQEIEQVQAELAAAVRGNEILQSEIQRTLDNHSVKAHELRDLKLQVVKKEENMKRLEINLQEAVKDMTNMKAALLKVSHERDEIWKELRQCSEGNMVLNSEKEKLKEKIEELEEKVLEKEGEITILEDSMGSNHFNLLSPPDFKVQ